MTSSPLNDLQPADCQRQGATIAIILVLLSRRRIPMSVSSSPLGPVMTKIRFKRLKQFRRSFCDRWGLHRYRRIRWSGGFGDWDFPHTELICSVCHTHKPGSRKRAALL